MTELEKRIRQFCEDQIGLEVADWGVEDCEGLGTDCTIYGKVETNVIDMRDRGEKLVELLATNGWDSFVILTYTKYGVTVRSSVIVDWR